MSMFNYDQNTINPKAIITCDKCGRSSNAPKGEHNRIFYSEGWSLNPNAKKYKHKCGECATPSERRAREFVNKKFGLS